MSSAVVISFALPGKEGLEQVATLRLAYAAGDLTTVIQGWKLQQVQGAASSAGLGIVCPEHHTSQTHMYAGAGAHGAGLLGDVKRAVGQAPVTDGFLRRRQGQHFGM